MKVEMQDPSEVPFTNVFAGIRECAENWTPQRVLTWAFETFGNRVAISSAFGVEGMVLIDMASRVSKDFRLFTIDTEFLFPETYALMDRIEEKYGITIEEGIPVTLSGRARARSRDCSLEPRARSMLQLAESRTSTPEAL